MLSFFNASPRFTYLCYNLILLYNIFDRLNIDKQENNYVDILLYRIP